MLEYGNLLVTVRDNSQLKGVSRSLTDHHCFTYLSELAVAETYQRQGIGKALNRRTKLETPQAKLILLAAPNSVDY